MLPDDAPADWNQPFLNLVAQCRTRSRAARAARSAQSRSSARSAATTAAAGRRGRSISTCCCTAERRSRPSGCGFRTRDSRSARSCSTPLAALEPTLTIPGRGTRTVLEHARAGRPPSAALDGHRESDARLVLRRRRARELDAVDAHVDASSRPRAPRSSTSAPSRRGPARRRYRRDEEWARLEPVLGRLVDRYRGDAAAAALSVDTYHVDDGAPRARARRRHHQRRQRPDDARHGRACGDERRGIGSRCTTSACRPTKHARCRRTRIRPPRSSAGSRSASREWQRAGLDLKRIVFDPGIGFGKNALQSLRLLRNVAALPALRAARARRALAQVVHASRRGRRAAPSAISSRSALRCGCATAASTSCACTTLPCTPPPIAAGRTRADLMPEHERGRWQPGDVVALRYITTDARIEMCWPCRVVEDSNELLALFIAAGSAYKAGPKRTAQAKRTAPRLDTPPDEYVWRNDTLRLMLPGQRHSVSLSWGRRRRATPVAEVLRESGGALPQDGRGIRHAGSHVGRRNHARSRVALA